MREIFAAFGTDGVQIINFIFHFIFYIFLRDVCGQAYGFFGILYGVIHWPVSSPATYQTFVVGVRYGAFDIYHTCTEDFVLQWFFEECFYKYIAVSAVKGITVRHIQFRTLILPVGYFDFGDRAHRTIGDDTLSECGNGGDMGSFFAVPTF